MASIVDNSTYDNLISDYCTKLYNRVDNVTIDSSNNTLITSSQTGGSTKTFASGDHRGTTNYYDGDWDMRATCNASAVIGTPTCSVEFKLNSYSKPTLSTMISDLKTFLKKIGLFTDSQFSEIITAEGYFALSAALIYYSSKITTLALKADKSTFMKYRALTDADINSYTGLKRKYADNNLISASMFNDIYKFLKTGLTAKETPQDVVANAATASSSCSSSCSSSSCSSSCSSSSSGFILYFI